ncbi:hypothetical protein HRJ45_24625, partial [Vibrio coralliilyticus]|nr:hypothetical protein [Vibrio coralliilyticus]
MKMKITNPQRMKLVAPLMVALLLSACGGDDSESLLSQPGANTLPGVTQPGEGSDGFCTWPDEKGLADCGGEDGNGDGYGDEGDSNQNGYCEPGEYRTRDCDGLYVAPVEDGSIDAEQGSPMVSVEVAPSELTVYKMLAGALSAQGTFENGQEKNVSGMVHWRSGDDALVSVYDPQSEGYDGSLESVSVTGVEVGSTLVTAEGSTSEMTSSSVVSVETGTVNVDSVSLQFENGNDTVTAGLTLQGYVEFELEEKPGETLSTLDEGVDSAEFVTWSLSPAVDGISVDENGLVTVASPLTDEMLEQSPITLTADFIDEGLFGDVPTKEASFTVVLGEVTGTDVVLERDGVVLTDADTIVKGDTLQGKAEVTFDDGSTYATQDATLVVWSVSPSDSG